MKILKLENDKYYIKSCDTCTKKIVYDHII